MLKHADGRAELHFHYCLVWPSCAYLSICVINICVKHSVMSAALHSRIYLLLYMWDSRMWKARPLLPFHPLGWVTNKLSRIPKCNLSNRSHTSQDTCLISGKQLSCSHEFVRASSRTDLTKDLGTDLESAHVLFPVQADSLKQAVLSGGGMGARTMAHMMCTENVQPAHLSSLCT